MASDSVGRIQDISTQIREAIRAALPTGSEQYLHVMVPGKVVDFDDYTVDKENDVIVPFKTELKQAILCDDMPTLSPIQMGPTGRSVARCYASAISKLIPSGTTVGVDDGKPLTDDQKRYKQAMTILSSEIEDKNMTLVELYTEKQAKYTRACAEKTKAFSEALEKATKQTKSNRAARQMYDTWVQENAKTWRNYVQAAYMEWVITGHKEEVEYWFSVVDQDSAMARIERSKEIMRWAVVQDEDGSGEYSKVKLEPANWANLAKAKAEGGKDQTKTVEWYTWEINRLEKTIALLETMINNPPTMAAPEGASDQEIEEKYKVAKSGLSEAMKTYNATEVAYREACAGTGKGSSDERKKRKEDTLRAYNTARGALEAKQAEYDEANLAKLQANSRAAQEKALDDLCKGGLAEKEIKKLESTIEDYKSARDKLQNGGEPSTAVVKKIASDMQIPEEAPDPAAVAVKETPDYFTPISVEVSSSSESSHSSESASSFSFGASASYGLFRASVSHTQSEAHSAATQELSSSSVKVSFECMRVDIMRPWLRPELFYDDELVCGPKTVISPGFGRLRELMDGDSKQTPDERKDELSQYNMFPLYPTAFLLACNVVLEISGSTSKLQSYMNSSSSASSVGVSYGPFFAGKASHSSSSRDQGSKCEATASGCRITIKSPQVIGWISQMIPALPRVGALNPAAAAAHT